MEYLIFPFFFTGTIFKSLDQSLFSCTLMKYTARSFGNELDQFLKCCQKVRFRGQFHFIRQKPSIFGFFSNFLLLWFWSTSSQEFLSSSLVCNNQTIICNNQTNRTLTSQWLHFVTFFTTQSSYHYLIWPPLAALCWHDNCQSCSVCTSAWTITAWKLLLIHNKLSISNVNQKWTYSRVSLVAMWVIAELLLRTTF